MDGEPIREDVSDLNVKAVCEESVDLADGLSNSWADGLRRQFAQLRDEADVVDGLVLRFR